MKKEILRVYRTRKETIASYDELSYTWDLYSGFVEIGIRNRGIKQLDIKPGEKVMEIGFGSGHYLTQMANAVGKSGFCYGIDISKKMVAKAQKRIDANKLTRRVKLTVGDAIKLPYKSNSLDAVSMSFILELFDTPEIPEVLGEIYRVLKKGGRLQVICISKTDGDSVPVKIYEWIHKNYPSYSDCRPIYPEYTLQKSKFKIIDKKKTFVYIYPVELVLGRK